jgi:hypothetical protein
MPALHLPAYVRSQFHPKRWQRLLANADTRGRVPHHEQPLRRPGRGRPGEPTPAVWPRGSEEYAALIDRVRRRAVCTSFQVIVRRDLSARQNGEWLRR